MPELGGLNLSGMKVSNACLEYFDRFRICIPLDDCPGVSKAAVRRFEESFRQQRPYFGISR